MTTDDLAAASNPACPNDAVTMRDEPGAWECPACGHRIEHPPVDTPPDFQGPDIASWRR